MRRRKKISKLFCANQRDKKNEGEIISVRLRRDDVCSSQVNKFTVKENYLKQEWNCIDDVCESQSQNLMNKKNNE